MGFHGFSPATGSGERPVVCRTCKTILVGRFGGGKLIDPACPRCSSMLDLFDARCPVCNAEALVFEDLGFPGFERKAVDLRDK